MGRLRELALYGAVGLAGLISGCASQPVERSIERGVYQSKEEEWRTNFYIPSYEELQQQNERIRREIAEEKKTEKKKYTSSQDADTCTAFNVSLKGLDKDLVKDSPILGRLIIFLLKTGIVNP